MEQARQKGIVFNKEKLQFKGKVVHFFGCTRRCEDRQQQGSSHTKHATPRWCQEPKELLGPSQLSYKLLSSPGHHYCIPSRIHGEDSSLRMGPRAWPCILCSQRKSIYFWCVKVLWPSRRNSNPDRCFDEVPWCHPPTEWSICVLGKFRSSWRGSRTAIVTIITKKWKAGLTLKPLHPGQPVRLLDHHTKTWEPGTILKAAKEPQSYNGKNNTTEGVYWRTRSHLRPDTTSSCQQSQHHHHHLREMEPPASAVGG